MKYYIVKINETLNTTEYKRYKCIDGWTLDKNICWQFSKQGAENIIKRLEKAYYRNRDTVSFMLENVNPAQM